MIKPAPFSYLGFDERGKHSGGHIDAGPFMEADMEAI